TADTIDDDGESVKLGLGTLPTGVTAGTPDETTVTINDDDEAVIQPQTAVKVSYGSLGYTIGEGQSISIKVVLDNDPERTVAIPISTTNNTGATDDDYSVVPASVTFDSGDTEKTITFTAVQDNEDESDETVTLGFGTMPAGVSVGMTSQATVTITDSIHVSFGASTYQAHEGGDGALVTVRLDSAPLLETVIPITATGMDGATDNDWTGVPESLTFGSGETEKSFTVMAYDDTEEDNGESVELSFGTLPAGVGRGTPDKATVELMNSEVGEPPACADAVWCAMVEFADVSDDWGNMALMYHPNQDPGPERSEISDDRFEFDDEEFFIWGIHTYPGVYPNTLAGAPGLVPERSVLSLSLGRWDHTERFSGRVSREHYMDWVLWVDGKAFPFSEASQATGLTFVWMDEKFQSLFADWSEGNEYQLIIESSPFDERPVPARTMPSPPRYLKVMHFNESFVASWINPLDDGNAPVTHYRLEWKPASASWDDQGSLLEAKIFPNGSHQSTNGYLVDGLTNGVTYDVRVVAVNSEGDSLPSHEHFARPQDGEPEIKRNTIDGDVLTLTYDRALDETSIPGTDRFIVSANSGRRLLDSVDISGRNVIITLESGVNSADDVEVRYVAPAEADSPAVKDTNGRYAFTLNFASEMSATENLTDPALLEDLTAEFVDIPDNHTGGEIRFKIRFSEPVQVMLGPYFAYLLDVEGGEVTSAWWLDRDTSLWQIVLVPNDTHDITVTLPAGRACNDGNSRGAPCASGDRRLTSTLEHTISGQDGPRDTR
ncbi:MAG: SwmB domain-containing protein, partial [Chloroflexi bacterium]|nr:SwmB domain-containing protein [Chloroflexota bacterium]